MVMELRSPIIFHFQPERTRKTGGIVQSQVLRLRIFKTGVNSWCDGEGPSLSPKVQEPGNPRPRTREMSVSANTERAPWHFLRLSV